MSYMSKLIRTSVTDPLRIATVPVGDKGGAVGITFAPGKHQTAAMTGIWQRDLGLDLEAIRQWGASDLITLLEPQEFAELGVSELPKATHEIGMRWHGLPITDGAAPDVRFLKPWADLERQLVGRLKRG